MASPSESKSAFNLLESLQSYISRSSTSYPLRAAADVQLEKISDMVRELHRPESQQISVEIVFFHGLHLGYYRNPEVETWCSGKHDKPECWLKAWLAKDFPKARILLISYDASPNQGSQQGRSDRFLTAETLACELLQFAKVGQTDKPVILVGHCIGGLVIKELCVLIARPGYEYGPNTDDLAKKFLTNLRGVFLYATPQLGMNLGEFAGRLDHPNPLLNDLKLLNEGTMRLNESFQKLRQNNGWRVAAVGELLKTDRFNKFEILVPESSARMDTDTYYSVATDHFGVCRPESESSTSYKALVYFLTTIMVGVQFKGPDGPCFFRARNDLKLVQTIDSESFGKSRSFMVSREGIEAYVRRKQTEKLILNALEDKDGPTVVLLHGNPGAGKSTLARYIAVHYSTYNQQLQGEIQPAVGSDSSSLLHSQRCTNFTVVFLECGLGASPTSKHLELLQNLSPETEIEVNQEEKIQDTVKIESRLQRILELQDTLIILDDVWDSLIVCAFVRLGNSSNRSNVKFLVTSRKSMLWSTCRPIEIQRTTVEEAEQILASHAGLAHNDIPSHLKDVVLRLVEQTENNPLALAMVGTRITRSKNTDREEWETVGGSYSSAVVQEVVGEGIDLIFQPVLDLPYKRSIGQTLLMTYRHLPLDSKRLLILIASCDSKSIPRHVLYTLFSRLLLTVEGDPSLFHHHLKGLRENGTMLQVQEQFELIFDPEGTVSFWKDGASFETFGLHDLQRQFINEHEETRSDVEKVMADLLDTMVDIKESYAAGSEFPMSKQHDDSILALCSLYLQEHYAKRASRNLEMSSLHVGYSRLKELRGAVGPLVLVMRDQAMECNNDLQSIRCAKQVFVNIVCGGEFDDLSLWNLLSSTKYGPATVTVLHNLCLSTLRSTLKVHVPCTVNNLLGALVKNQGSYTPTMALHLYSLRKLCCYSVHKKEISEYPGAIEALANFLSVEKSLMFSGHAITTLGNVAIQEEGRKKIGECSGVLLQLLTWFMEQSGNLAFQEEVVRTLQWLAINADNGKQIREHQGALKAWVNYMVVRKSSKFLESVLYTLGNLAIGVEGGKEIGEIPGAISQLLTMFLQQDGCLEIGIQDGVLFALQNLSLHVPNRKQIMEFAGAVQGLVRSLSVRNSSKFLEFVLHTVGRLAIDVEGREEIGEIPEAFPQLLTMFLQEDGSLEIAIQERLVLALRNLALHEPNRTKIMEFPGALQGLVRSLSVRKSSEFLVHVLYTLGSLAIGVKGRKEIGEIPGAIPQLLTMFLQEDGSLGIGIQEGAVFALRNLSFHVPNRKQIMEFAGAVQGLVRSLSVRNSSKFLEFVLHTVGTLALGVESREEIGENPEAISQLLTMFLQEDGSLEIGIQERLMFALQNLAFNEPNRQKIMEFPGAVQGLVRSLSVRKSSTFLVHVLRTLGCLASSAKRGTEIGEIPGAIPQLLTMFLHEDGSLQIEIQEGVVFALQILSVHEPNRKKIMEFPGAVQGLVRSLSVRKSSAFLKRVLYTLGNLAMGVEGGKEIGQIPGAILQLLTIFLQQDGSLEIGIEEGVVFALRNLALNQPNRKQIMEFPGAVHGLVRSLSVQKSSTFLQFVSHTVGRLAIGVEGREEIEEIPEAISQLLKMFLQEDGGLEIGIQERLVFALRNLALNEPTRKIIMEFPGAVQGLVRSLSVRKCSQLLESVLYTLGNLAIGVEGGKVIGEIPGAISQLLAMFLQQDGSVEIGIQEGVVFALQNLSRHAPNRKQIMEFAGAVQGLVRSLSVRNSSKFLEFVLHTVGRLAIDVEGREEIGEIPEAFSQLLTMFLQEDGSLEIAIQERLVLALRNLALHEPNRTKIMEFPGALHGLVRSLSVRKSSEFLVHVLYTLGSLASGVKGGKEIGEIPGAISQLLTMFLQEDGSLGIGIQEGVVFALRNLSRHVPTRIQIMEFPGAVRGVVWSLSVRKSSEVLVHILYTIGNLAKGVEGGKEIGEISGAISQLLTMFLQEDGSLEIRIQEGVVFALRSLSSYVPNRKKIMEFPGAVQGLLRSLSVPKCSKFLESVLYTLGTLAMGMEGGKEIREIPGAILQVLTMFLQEDGSLEIGIQEGVVFALRTLSFHETNLKQIMEFPGAVQGLVRSLSVRKSSKFLELVLHTVGTLTILVEGREEIGEIPEAISQLLTMFLQEDGSLEIEILQQLVFTLKNLSLHEPNRKKIMEFPGAVQGLVRSLSIQKCSRFLKFVVYTLGNLAIGVEGGKEIGEIPGAIPQLLTMFLQQDRSLEIGIQEAVVFALRNLSLHEPNRKQIMEFAGAVQGFVRSLSVRNSSRRSSEFLVQVLYTLGNLAIGVEGGKEIGEIPGAISQLLTMFLQQDGSLEIGIQDGVVFALRNLSLHVPNRKQIMEFAGAVQGLVRSLSVRRSFKFLELVLHTVGRLAIDVEGREEIGEIPEAFPQLLTMFLQEEGSLEIGIHEQLVFALRKLSLHEPNRKKIMEFPGAVQGLVRSLSVRKCPNFLESVLYTLGNLAIGVKGGKEIGEIPGAISQLLTMFLQEDGSHEIGIQEGVVFALRNLSLHAPNRKQIMEFAGAVQGLVTSLSVRNSSKFLDFVLHTVGRLAMGVEGREEIGEIPEAIPQLLTMFLHEEGSLELGIQERLVFVVRNLALHELNRKKIMEFPGALQGLVMSLAVRKSSKFLVHVLYTLGNLAIGVEGGKDIGELPGAISRLLTMFVQEDGSLEIGIQKAVVFALRNLSRHVPNRN